MKSRGAHSKANSMDAQLRERAARYGIETQYHDGFGQPRTVGPDVLGRLLGALARERPTEGKVLPGSIIARGGADVRVPSELPDNLPVAWEILSGGQAISQGQTHGSEIALLGDLPQGIFSLRVIAEELGGQRRGEAPLIVCPKEAYQGDPGRRMWALAVQLYAVRSERNWGHGDFSDLTQLIDMAADQGAAGIGLNPLHALFEGEASPYFPNSRLFLNPLYIDLEAVPEFAGRAAGLEQEIAALRAGARIDYAAVARTKTRALEMAHAHFRENATAKRRAAFDSFRAQHPFPLAPFACFEFLRRRFGAPWWEWPEKYRRPDPHALDALYRSEEARISFFEYLQWLAHEQIERCCARASDRGMPIGLYLDIAVGVRSDGFDAWCDQDAILADTAIGAPPDALNSEGQNWGLAGFNPLTLEQQLFEPFVRMLRASMQYAGAVRLDHVLGLCRLYLIPHGASSKDGAYIRLPFEPLLAVAALASERYRCIVIGEDLGTVPQDFRQRLQDWGIWSYHVMLFERSGDGQFTPPEAYRDKAVVAFGTHDTPTFAGWHQALDLQVKRTLQIEPGETKEERVRALAALRGNLDARGIHALDFLSVAKYLAHAPSRLLLISLEDLYAVSEQVNLPGTSAEYPNWSQVLPVHLEEMRSRPELGAVAATMREAGRSFS
jgi:4-alpha-glucanotransferase